MYRYFLRPEIRSQYYNCSARTYDEWAALGNPNLVVGLTYITLGILFFTTYFPFMIVFLKSDLLKLSCYKIMFFLGIVDMIQIPMGAFVGYCSMVGMVFCMAPTLLYVFGSLVLAVWIVGSSTCMLLALNRCIDLLNHNLAVILFDGKKTYIWLMIPTVYGLSFGFFYPSVIYSSILHAFFFDPFFGMPERLGTIDGEHYPFRLLSTHNVVVAVWLAVAYGGLCLKLSLRSRGLTKAQMNRVQRQAFMTALLICTGTFVAALVYSFLQFVPLPGWVAFIGEIGWQFSHGMVGLTYLLMNPTMRREAAKIFFNKNDISVTAQTITDTKKATLDSSTMNGI